MAQNNEGAELVSVHSTVILRWEVTKEEFDRCVFDEEIESPTYLVKIGSEESKWRMSMYPRGDDEEDEDNVVIFLELVISNQIHKVQYGFRAKTPTGYWPKDISEIQTSSECFEQIREFGGNGSWKWGWAYTTTDYFGEQFVDDKITIVATLMMDMEGKSNQNQTEVTDDFIKDMRSKCIIDHDFTVICNGKRIPCHKFLLCLRSKFFKAMFEFEKDKTEMKIDDASIEMVESVIEFMSDGLIPEEIDEIAMELIPVADVYGPEALTKVCAESLVNNLSPENAVETLILIDRHHNQLRSKVLDFIKKDAAKVVNSKDWDKLVRGFPALVKDMILAIVETSSDSEA